jgi:hypothetical protein
MSSPEQRETGMAEFSRTDRLGKVALGPALFCAWWYFSPDYAGFFAAPLGELTISDIMWHIFWLLLLVRWLFATISWLYEAWTRRDSVWLWHPD